MSDPAPETPARRFGRYLTSAKNLGGVAGAVAASVATVAATTYDNAWPLAAAAGYGLVAAVAPRRRTSGAEVAARSARSAQALKGELQPLVDRGDKAAGQMPPAAYSHFRRIVDTLRRILDRSVALQTSPDDLHVVTATIRDYLPTSLDGYLAVPSGYRDQRTATGRTPGEELTTQLQLLADELGRVEDSLYRGDLQSLAVQSRFLEDKFRRSDLDLDLG